MSDTPETDAFREVVFTQYKEDELTGNGMGNILAALTNIETLERKRECECKCDVDWPEEYYELRQRLESERDEALESLKHIGEYGTEEINAAVDLRQNLASALVERDEARSDLEFRRGLFKVQEEQLNNVREERDKYKGLLIRLYNDLFVHHKGEAVRDFKALFREENYN